MEADQPLNQLLAGCLGKNIREVVVCGRQLRPPPYSYVVAFPRLEIPVKGCYENQIERQGKVQTIQLRPGTALFSAANCWNLPTWQHDVTLVSILFGKRHLGISIVTGASRVVPELTAQKLSIPFPISGPLPHVLNAIIELQNESGPPEAFVELSSAIVRCVNDLIQRPASQPIPKAQNLLDSVCVYLQNHYQYDITRDSVAHQFEVSPNHLSRLFRTHGHMTFNEYLTHVRIDRGKYLLCHYNLKIEDVAGRCGYSNAAYFARVFKRITRTTPAEYRAAYFLRKMAGVASR
jgi:AraC-like DNA-binding protein